MKDNNNAKNKQSLESNKSKESSLTIVIIICSLISFCILFIKFPIPVIIVVALIILIATIVYPTNEQDEATRRLNNEVKLFIKALEKDPGAKDFIVDSLEKLKTAALNKGLSDEKISKITKNLDKIITEEKIKNLKFEKIDECIQRMKLNVKPTTEETCKIIKKIDECIQEQEIDSGLKPTIGEKCKAIEKFIVHNNKIIELINNLERAIQGNSYQEYENLYNEVYSMIFIHVFNIGHFYEAHIFGENIVQIANKLFCNLTESLKIDEIISKFHKIRNNMIEFLDSDDCLNVGKFGKFLEDLEECMKYKNFWDYFFIDETAEEQIPSLHFKGLNLENVKRKMEKKLLYYRNLATEHHPGVVILWETIRHHRALEDTENEIANHHENMLETYQEIAKLQEEGNERLSNNLENVVNLLSSIEDKQKVGNLLSVASLASDNIFNSEIIRELKSSKKIAQLSLGLSAYEALQMRKIKKSLE